MYSTEIPSDLRDDFKNDTISQYKPDIKERCIKYPDHGFIRTEKQVSLLWNEGFLPKLHNNFWWFKKWADTDTYVQYRACINTLELVYNSWTNLLRAKKKLKKRMKNLGRRMKKKRRKKLGKRMKKKEEEKSWKEDEEKEALKNTKTKRRNKKGTLRPQHCTLTKRWPARMKKLHPKN